MVGGIERLRCFIGELTGLIDRGADEAAIIESGGAALRSLVAVDDWLPPDFAEPNPESYRQYLLYCDPWERFSIVSFVWGPGQRTPIHDHTVWGLIGMLRGAEISRDFALAPARGLVPGAAARLEPGTIAAVSPRIGDIHTVENALADRPSISIHAYGANIGAVARHVFVPDTGAAKPFVSGYANRLTPNLWDRSVETRARLGI